MGKKEDAIAAVQAAAGVFADKVRPIVLRIKELGRALTEQHQALGSDLYDAAVARGDFDFARKVLRASVESVIKSEGLTTEKGSEGGKMLDSICRMATYYAQVRAGMIGKEGKPTEQPTEEAAAAGFKPTSKPQGSGNGDGSEESGPDPLLRPVRENVEQATSWLSIVVLQAAGLTAEQVTADDVIALTALSGQVNSLLAWLRTNVVGKDVASKIAARLAHDAEKVA